MSLDLTAIDTLFLDAGGVLVHPNWSRVSEALARYGIDVSAAVLATAEPYAKRELDDPGRTAATDDDSRSWLYFDLVLSHARVEGEREAVWKAWAELREYHSRFNLWETVPTEVPPALARFRQAGLRLVVVSNANGTLHAHLRRLGLYPSFDLVLDSYDLGVEKPDPRLFLIALERAGSKAPSTLHVGDLYHVDVVGARAAGLQAVLFDAAGLYADYDCPRVSSLLALADSLRA